jgi:Cytotoxic
VARVPIPSPCYLDMCEYIGASYGRKRWRSRDGGSRLFEWDDLHGEIEIYNRRGKHLGVLDPQGNLIGEAVPGRTIDV